MKTVSKSSLDGLGPDDDPTSTATTERRYFTQSAPDEDVAPQMTLPGYRFGKDLVPVAGADAEKIKYGVDAKLLQTIGVMPQEELPRREQRAERKARREALRTRRAPEAKHALLARPLLARIRMPGLFCTSANHTPSPHVCASPA